MTDAIGFDSCPACSQRVGLSERGYLKLHYPTRVEIRPCAGSWKLAADVVTPAQSATDSVMMAKVIDRIRKLLALAGNNPSSAEAASAKRRADELMAIHKVVAA